MTRMLDLVADTRRLIYGSMSDQLNFLAQEAPLGAGELFMSMDVASITPGMTLSSGLNVYYVIGVEPGPKRVIVYPTYDNSLSEALPVGAPIMIRPRATDWLLFTNLNNIVQQMSASTSGLYRHGWWTDNEPGIYNDYPIPTIAQDMTGLIRVSVKEYGSDEGWFEIPPNSVKWQPEHGTIRITGYSLRGREVQFDYKAPFKTATSLTDDVEVDMGLALTMTDIPPLGAAARLLRTTEGRRSQIHAQGDSRRADEVPGGQNASAAREFDRDFRNRMNDEHIRLVNRNPWVRQI